VCKDSGYRIADGGWRIADNRFFGEWRLIFSKLNAEIGNFSLGSGRAIPARTERLFISFEVVSSVRSGGPARTERLLFSLKSSRQYVRAGQPVLNVFYFL
jgi:hypothetical protein